MISIELGEVKEIIFNVLNAANQPALGEEGNFPELMINSGSWTTNGLSPLISLGFGRYVSMLNTNLLPLQNGDVIQVRYKGVSSLETFPISFIIGSQLSGNTSIDYYGTLQEANIFFANKLNAEPWNQATSKDKISALITATQLIDRLSFISSKENPLQPLEFPRKNIGMPDGIKAATWHIAIMLLDGYDPEIEAEKLMTEMNKYSSVQSYYERDFIPDYKVAGIPSAVAWGYLRPYLRDAREISLSRIG
jgi:hypothetical protein